MILDLLLFWLSFLVSLNFSLFQLKTLSYVQITDSGQLRILGTQELDAGDYKCEARNEAGSDSATVTLVVGCKKSIILLNFFFSKNAVTFFIY